MLRRAGLVTRSLARCRCLVIQLNWSDFTLWYAFDDILASFSYSYFGRLLTMVGGKAYLRYMHIVCDTLDLISVCGASLDCSTFC